MPIDSSAAAVILGGNELFGDRSARCAASHALTASSQARIDAAPVGYAATGHGDVKSLKDRPGELRLRAGKWRVFFGRGHGSWEPARPSQPLEDRAGVPKASACVLRPRV